MPQFLLLLFVIAAVVSLLYGIANSNPATLARNVRRGAVAVCSLLAIALAVASRWTYALPLALAAFIIYRSAGGSGASGSGSNGRKSRVTSAFFAMELDHDAGDMDGEILRGKFAGRWLSSLGDAELQDLVGELGSDEQSADLLESYLERRDPHWRQKTSGADNTPPPRSAGMSVKDARRILGVAPNATDREIKAAHRALMKDMHPDQGGSTQFATRLNQARDILLKKPTRQR